MAGESGSGVETQEPQAAKEPQTAKKPQRKGLADVPLIREGPLSGIMTHTAKWQEELIRERRINEHRKTLADRRKVVVSRGGSPDNWEGVTPPNTGKVMPNNKPASPISPKATGR